MNSCLFTADTWPEVLCDDNARADWNWKPQYDIKATCKAVFEKLIPFYHMDEPRDNREAM